MKSKLSFGIICTITLALAIVKISDSNFGKNGNYGVIDWDNFGYYLYLPATFIYNDIRLEDEEWIKQAQTQYDLSTSLYQVNYFHYGNYVIRYSSGMALLYSPAFLIGHLSATFSSYPADGFSAPYQISILIYSFLIVFLGLFYLRKFALFYFDEKVASIIILIICLGTNYFQVSSANVSSPHAYLFTLYAAALFYTVKWHHFPKLKYSLLLAFLISLMALCRPNEIFFLIIPLLWRGGKFKRLIDKYRFLFSRLKELITLGIPFLLIGSIQILYWRYAAREWIYDSYHNESFKLLSPYLKEYLFSYKKGWLLYTPIMWFGLVGLILLFKKNIIVAIPITLFTLVNIWILSSWDCWWYADSFSQRSIVQAYPIFILPFGYLIQFILKKQKILQIGFFTIIFALLSFNLFQTYQFTRYIIHPSGMTKEYYWNIFGKLNAEKIDRSLIEMDRSIHYLPEPPLKKHKLVYYEEYSNLKGLDTLEVREKKYKMEGALMLTPENPNSEKIRFAYADIADSSYCYVVCRIRFKSEFEAQENKFGIEFSNIDSYNNKPYEYRYRGVEDISWFEKGVWQSMDIVVIPAYLRNKEDSIEARVTLFGDEPVLIDNFSIEILDPSSHPLLQSLTFFNDYYTITKGDWTKPSQVVSNKGLELLDSTHLFSSLFNCSIKDLESKNKLTFESNLLLEDSISEAFTVVSVNNKRGEQVFYDSKPILKKKDGWQKEVTHFTLPNKLDSEYTLKAYVWNKEGQIILIRSLRLTAS